MTTQFFVAVLKDNTPQFAENPKPHDTYALAVAEAERLANLHKGDTFRVYGSTPKTFMVPKPTIKTYSANELMTSAPAGVYSSDRGAPDRHRIEVFVGISGSRSVLYISSKYGLIDQFNPGAWCGVKFTLTGEPSRLTAKP